MTREIVQNKATGYDINQQHDNGLSRNGVQPNFMSCLTIPAFPKVATVQVWSDKVIWDMRVWTFFFGPSYRGNHGNHWYDQIKQLKLIVISTEWDCNINSWKLQTGGFSSL
jgi:hypothetical protein